MTSIVGADARKPLSVTSSTVSPIDNTRVALLNETTMKRSYASPCLPRTVHTALGLPGSSDTAISVTATPCLRTLREDLQPRPHNTCIWGAASPARSSTSMSVMGARESTSSVLSRFLSFDCGVNRKATVDADSASSPSSSLISSPTHLAVTASGSSPIP